MLFVKFPYDISEMYKYSYVTLSHEKDIMSLDISPLTLRCSFTAQSFGNVDQAHWVISCF